MFKNIWNDEFLLCYADFVENSPNPGSGLFSGASKDIDLDDEEDDFFDCFTDDDGIKQCYKWEFRKFIN